MANKPIYTGIDISHWNSVSDWDKLADSVDFIILKAGGWERSAYQDKTFASRYNACVNRGIPVGCYYFAGKNFTSAQTGRDYAEHFARLIKGKKFEAGVWLDNETTSIHAKIGATDAAINFCNYMERLGYFCGIYGSEISVFKNRYILEQLDKYAKWVARYGSTPTMSTDMWQKTSSGRVAGISGLVDVDEMYTDIIGAIRKKRLYGEKNK